MNKSKMTWVLTGIVGLFASTVGAATLIQHHTFDSDFSDAFSRTATGVGDAQITTDAKVGGGSLLLDGSGDSVSLGTAAINLTDWSMAAWIKPTSAADGFQAIYATPWQDGGAHFNYQVTSSVPNVGISLSHGATAESASTTTNVPLPPTDWFHVALTRVQSGTLRLYINGVEEASTGATADSTNLGLAANIGSWDTSRYFSGQIDDFRIYSGALSASEVSTLAIPEPGSVMLFCVGLVATLFGRRRFRK